MKRKLIYWAGAVMCLTLLKCQPREYLICDFQSDNVQLKIYNDVLNELVEHHFYNGYLGAEGDSIFERHGYYSKTPDSTKLRKEIIILQNEIFSDTSKFQTLGFNTSLSNYSWDFYLKPEYGMDTTQQWRDLKNSIKVFSPNWSKGIETLTTAQKDYSYKDFHLCTSKVIPALRLKDCDIGMVSFSKVIINESKTKALLYYEFFCG